jgi:hypothetical protein
MDLKYELVFYHILWIDLLFFFPRNSYKVSCKNPPYKLQVMQPRVVVGRRIQKAYPLDRGNGFAIHEGVIKTVVKRGNDPHVKVRFPGEPDLTKYAWGEVKNILIPKRDDYIGVRSIFSQTHQIVIGKVTKVEQGNTRDRNGFGKYKYTQNYGNPGDLGWASEDYKSLYKFTKNSKGAPMNNFYVILNGDPLATKIGNISLHNTNVLFQSTPQFPVALFKYLHKINMLAFTLPFVMNGSGVIPRLQALKSRYLEIEPFKNKTSSVENEDSEDEDNDEDNDSDGDDLYFSNLILRGVKHTTGLKTMFPHMVTEKIDFKHIYNKTTIQWYSGEQVQSFNNVTSFRQAFKGLQTAVPPNDMLGQLINSKLLQGVELSTLTSFLGSRIHQKIMLASCTTGNQPQPQLPGVFNNPLNIDPTKFQLVLQDDQQLFDKQVELLSNLDSLESLVNIMYKHVLNALKKEKLEIIACEVPVWTSMRTFTHGRSDAQHVMESRIDFIAKQSDGKLVLGEYKSRLGNGNQYKILDVTYHMRQAILYAFLLLENFHIFVDYVMVIYANRKGDVGICKFPFKQVSNNTSKDNVKEILQQWIHIDGYICDQFIVSQTHKKFAQKSVLSEYAYLDFWYSAGTRVFDRRNNLGERIQGDDFFRKGARSGVITIKNRRMRFNTQPEPTDLWLINHEVYAWLDINDIEEDAPPIQAAFFFHPEIIHPVLPNRLYGPYTSKVDGRRVEESGAKKASRKAFNNLIYEEGKRLAGSYPNMDSDALHTKFTTIIVDKERPERTSIQTWRIRICVRALQVEVNKRLLEQTKNQGVVSRVNAAIGTPSQPVEQYPLSAKRFERFEHLSQRPAWHTAMYDYAENELVDNAYKYLEELLV